jgi:two-component system, NtrC family, response regulator AtoC
MHSEKNGLPQLLFVDEEQPFRDFISRHLSSVGYVVFTAEDWEQAQTMIGKQLEPDVIFVDPLTLKKDLKEICADSQETPVIVLSAARQPRVIVDAMKRGARDYLCKPLSVEEIAQSVQEVMTLKGKPAARPKAVVPKNSKLEFISCNPKMKQIQDIVLQIANARVPVLIQGESGVGKDVVARMIHQYSKLSAKPFVKVNCAALPAELTESELFGYEKGAFTGAHIDRPGKFEFANGGTIFLDEIAEFTPSVQAKLLQVLQDGRFTRLGSNAEIEVDVRIIAATNKKLEEAIEDGRFREDLYYRLNVVNVEIPPLRQRREEIPILCEHFVEKFSREFDNDIRRLPDELMELFNRAPWPGNVRELENVVKRYIVLQDVEAIRTELEARMSRHTMGEIEALAESYLQDNGNSLDLKEISRRAAYIVEKNMIIKTLRSTSWNKWKAAKELRVSYKTLLTKIEQYEIKPGPY